MKIHKTFVTPMSQTSQIIDYHLAAVAISAQGIVPLALGKAQQGGIRGQGDPLVADPAAIPGLEPHSEVLELASARAPAS